MENRPEDVEMKWPSCCIFEMESLKRSLFMRVQDREELKIYMRFLAWTSGQVVEKTGVSVYPWVRIISSFLYMWLPNVVYFYLFIFWPHHAACGILVP